MAPYLNTGGSNPRLKTVEGQKVKPEVGREGEARANIIIVEEHVSTAEEKTGKGRYTSVCLEIYLSRAATTGVYIHDMRQPSTLVGPHRMSTWGCDSCT